MSDRIERLRLDDKGVLLAQIAQPDSKDTPFADVIAFLGGDIDDTETLLKIGHAIANAQLDKVLDAEVECPMCYGSGVTRDATLEFECRLCGNVGAVNVGYTSVYHKGTGRISIRTLLERDGGEK